MACAAFSYMSRDWDPNMTFLANRPIVKMNGIGNAIAVLDLRGSDHVVSGTKRGPSIACRGSSSISSWSCTILQIREAPRGS